MGWASTDEIIITRKESLWIAKPKTNKNDPQEIEWISDQGLKKINRKISFDENFMITIEDVVSNQTGRTIQLTNYSYINEKITDRK